MREEDFMAHDRSFLFRNAIPIGLVMALALGLRLYRLGHENFWFDEFWQVKIASHSVGDIIVNYLNYGPSAGPGESDQAPLSYLITHFFLASKDNEWHARLPSAIFGTLGVLAIFLVGRELFSYRVALLAAILLAFSPLHLWYSQEARWYAQWSSITTFSYILLLHACKSGRAASWVSYGLLTLLNIYTFIYALFVVVAQAITAWWLQRLSKGRRMLLVKFALGHLLIACAAAPVLWRIFTNLNVSTGTPRAATLMELPYTFFAYTAGFTVGPTLRQLHALPGVFSLVADYPSIVVFFAVFLPVFALGIHRVTLDPPASALLLPWLFAPPILAFLIGVLSNVTYQVRYTFASLPAFVLILALGALSLKPRIVRAGVIALILLCAGYSVANFYWNPRYDREDVRAAVAYINARPLEASLIISLGQIEAVVKYYGPNLNIIEMERCDVEVDRDGSPRKATFHPQVIWVIAGRDWNHTAEACLSRLSQSYSVIDKQSFTGIELWLLKERQEYSASH
jgi:mannosyltransferase